LLRDVVAKGTARVMSQRARRGLLFGAAAYAAGARAAPAAECVVPAKAGGGFEVTCKLAQAMLAEQRPLGLSYLPGGIGAVAYTSTITDRPAQPNTLIAFSSGSLLNLAQGKFGPHTEADVRWLAVIGTDHGVIAVRQDSAYRTLAELLQALRSNPRAVSFAAGGTLGSQDWFKAALLARAAGVSHKAIRFVAFEGGGDALNALQGGHVGVFTGDAAEVHHFVARGGAVRLLAVLSAQRLPGALASVPTAREQNVDLVWRTARGLYLGPQVPDAAFRDWAELLRKAMHRPGYREQLQAQGLYPMSLTGAELEAFVRDSMADYRRLAAEFELPKR
jgi:putative tricarboxylic transport membrane protein